jgi:hypothetical protein
LQCGHGHASWTWSVAYMYIRHRHAAKTWICRMDIELQCRHSYSKDMDTQFGLRHTA